MLSLGVVAYAASADRTLQPETVQGEQIPAEAPQNDGEKPSDLLEMNSQPPQMNGQAPNGEAPSDLPDLSEMDGAAPVMGGLLNELLAEGIITQAEYDAMCEATAK